MKTLKEVREERGIKQLAVAEHLGIARQTYAGYEDNPQSMSIAQAQAVCKFLHCPIEEIFLSQEVN
jgi:putative transcriptional regulator